MNEEIFYKSKQNVSRISTAYSWRIGDLWRIAAITIGKKKILSIFIVGKSK